ncbi:hypothetical protein EDB82DRAFT_517846 [Fusarium venenatum]|nr:hypothetical protein EDB82DRAFT_517846 [Fusarium venenatum]
MDVYLDAWELYNEAAVRVDHILNQANATWIESHISGGIRELFYIHTLHCVKWHRSLQRSRLITKESTSSFMRGTDLESSIGRDRYRG